MSFPGFRNLLPILGVGLLTLGLPSFAGTPPKEAPPVADVREIQVPKPPFSEGIFPCSTCHDPKTMPANTKRRPLEGMHGDIELHHGPESRWCLDCHDAGNRDKLHLVSGEKIDFTASYLLCGQCHGDKYRDWRVGVHGKRTGSWNGAKEYRLCVNCHNPHSPHFKALKPMAPPTPPEQIVAKKGTRK
jgi:hypothetical protein